MWSNGCDRGRWLYNRGMSTALRLAAPLALLSLLAACVPPPDGPGGRPLLNPRYGPAASSGKKTAPDGKPAGPPPSQAELAADPGRFKGLVGGEVTLALGEPKFRRREPPAEIWQYFGEACVLDLFLYGEPNNELRVTYVELRSRIPGQAAEPACLSPLFTAGRPSS